MSYMSKDELMKEATILAQSTKAVLTKDEIEEAIVYIEILEEEYHVGNA